MALKFECWLRLSRSRALTSAGGMDDRLEDENRNSLRQLGRRSCSSGDGLKQAAQEKSASATGNRKRGSGRDFRSAAGVGSRAFVLSARWTAAVFACTLALRRRPGLQSYGSL